MPSQIVKGEIKTWHHHEEGTDTHNKITIEKADALIMGWKPADSDSRETMAYRIKQGHAGQVISQGT